MMPVEQEAIDQFVEDELKAEKIHKSKLPYASPCFFIAKKDGSCCLVQDYQKINAFTVTGDTTTYTLKKVMNGKPPSSH